MHLGDHTRETSSQQPDGGTGDRAAGSSPQQFHRLEAEEAVLLLQQSERVEDVESPAEVLTTGQSTHGLFLTPTVSSGFQGVGPLSPAAG